MNEETWAQIDEFPNYEISNYGRVFNRRRNQEMRTSNTNYGHVKINLASGHDGSRHTRSVAYLVGQAFVKPPTPNCDHLILLDGNLNNISSDNLAWRPRWFAWKYVGQLRNYQPLHYHNLPVRNLSTGEEYDSIVQAGITEGLLFDDIWRSTYSGNRIFPYGHTFEIVKRV